MSKYFDQHEMGSYFKIATHHVSSERGKEIAVEIHEWLRTSVQEDDYLCQTYLDYIGVFLANDVDAVHFKLRFYGVV